MGASIRKVDMATPLKRQQSEAAYKDMFSAPYGGASLLGKDIDGVPKNEITPELLAQNPNQIPPYLRDFAARAEDSPTFDDQGPKPSAEKLKEQLPDPPQPQETNQNDENRNNLNMELEDDPAYRLGQIMGLGIVGGRDYYARLKNEKNSKASGQPASAPKAEDSFMKDMAPAAEAAKADHQEKRYSNKLEKKIGANPNAAPKGMGTKQPVAKAAQPAQPKGMPNYANTSRGKGLDTLHS